MPILVPDLLKIFSEKLDRTGSFDDAFTKAMWMAYKQGIEDERKGKNLQELFTSRSEEQDVSGRV